MLAFCSVSACVVVTFKWNQHWLGLVFMRGFVVHCSIFCTKSVHRNVTNDKISAKPCEKQCPNFLVACCYRRLPICLLTMKLLAWSHRQFLLPQHPAFLPRQKNFAVYFQQVIFCNWNNCKVTPVSPNVDHGKESDSKGQIFAFIDFIYSICISYTSAWNLVHTWLVF